MDDTFIIVFKEETPDEQETINQNKKSGLKKQRNAAQRLIKRRLESQGNSLKFLVALLLDLG